MAASVTADLKALSGDNVIVVKDDTKDKVKVELKGMDELMQNYLEQ